jgi:hypothetical protein
MPITAIDDKFRIQKKARLTDPSGKLSVPDLEADGVRFVSAKGGVPVKAPALEHYTFRRPRAQWRAVPPGPPPQGTARMAANISRFKLDANEAKVGISSQTQSLPNLREKKNKKEEKNNRHDEEQE